MWDKIVPGRMQAPKFSAYPWRALRHLTRREAALESAVARWLAARPRGQRLEALVGAPATVAIVRVGAARDPHAARCELRRGGETIDVIGGGALVRAVAQRVLGGPSELPAPRPLRVIEQAVWALVVAAAVEDLGVAGEVWPALEPRAPSSEPGIAVELEVAWGGNIATVVAVVPRSLELRVPPRLALPAWVDRVTIAAPVVLARCAVTPRDLTSLAVRDLVTVERCSELEIFGGVLELRMRQNAVVAEVMSEYVRRDVAFADDAQVELAVTVGSARLPLRQVLDLAIGQIIELGRPLAGPFDVCAAGRLIGRGELVDVDGELAVRIVSLDETSE
jgi:flagellar motor switch/type III secretory pathway protein FliN